MENRLLPLHNIPLAFLTALTFSAGMSVNADPLPSDIQFLDIDVESELQQSLGLRPLYAINYTVRNAGDETLTYLKVAIVGRNQDGQIVEVADSQIFYSGSLPQGLAPSDEIVRRHGLEVTNPNETVISVELSVIEIR
jgi:hypothetical protein